jgi:hypothetical protein
LLYWYTSTDTDAPLACAGGSVSAIDALAVARQFFLRLLLAGIEHEHPKGQSTHEGLLRLVSSLH